MIVTYVTGKSERRGNADLHCRRGPDVLPCGEALLEKKSEKQFP
jgi:hypothetical protein